jgi:ribonuclease-3
LTDRSSPGRAVQGPLASLEVRLGHTFRDVRLLQQALTHRSFSADHNERLEFLGDSVLNLGVAHILYSKLSDLPEGDLSRVRANLVKQDTLHQLALSLELPGLLRLGEGELRSGGAKRASILADALEALLGAVYLDGGAEAAQQLVQRLFSQVDIRPDMQAASKDPKTELQEWLQARKMTLPRYTVIATHGAAHRQTFDVACEVQELRQYERGTGASRRAAEQAAAAALLQTLKAGAKA